VAKVATPLLATKLFVPPARPGLVSRSRLMERMRVALNYGLVLVSAPAGSGKTTLVSDWTRHIEKTTPAAWVSLDEGDNDPVRFWDYFIAALGEVTPSVGDTAASLLHSTPPSTTESVLAALVNDLVGVPNDFVVVLDDYHVIKSEAIHTSVTFLIEHLPPRMHMVIATRTEPPFPLSSLRGRGTMLDIGAEDLRFTIEETAALFKNMQNLELTPEHVSALNARTEGWAVGLAMAALSMGKQKDIHGFVAEFTGSQRYAMDYLADEVLKRQSDEVRHFLLKTSVLERLTGSLCDHVSGREGSQAMLEDLEKANLFLVPLDESREWYRYHHLFAELLRQQLHQTSGDEELNRLHRKASEWHENNRLVDGAIHHALAARDWERAMRLIYVECEARIKRGEWDTLFGWFQMMPEDVLHSNPRLYSQYANVLITRSSLEAAEAILGRLETASQTDATLQGEVAFFQAVIAYRRGDLKRTVESLEKALEQLPEESGAMRVRALHMLGVFDMGAGRLGRAQSREAEVVRTARRVGESWVGATAAGNLSLILLLRGRLRQAIAAGQQAVDLAGQSPASAGSRSALGVVLYERNELEGAARSSRLAIKWSELSGYAESRLWAYYCLAQALLANGDVAGAEKEMVKGDEASRHLTASPVFRAWHTAHRVMFAIQRGDLAGAVDWGSQLSELPLAFFWAQHAPARLLIAQGHKTVAAEQLHDLYQKFVQGGAEGYAITLRVCQALAAATPAEALTFLVEALTKGEPEGYVRTFVDEGELLAPLLRKALAQGITPEYTAQLLNIIEAEDRQRKMKNELPAASSANPDLLGARELEVLRLVSEGLSNSEIATKLMISLSTAKTHVHHLLEKLYARDRAQAVRRAKELKLI
jgi:LuxR family maltose regulon positive regulatory protein